MPAFQTRRPQEAEPAPVRLSAEQRAAAHFLKGLIARNEGDSVRALDEMLRAAALDPGQPRIRQQLVELYVRQADLDRAVEQAQALAAMAPDNPQYRLLAADLLSAVGRAGDAIDAYEAVLAHVPNNEEVLVKLGALYTREGEAKKGIALLTRGGPEGLPSGDRGESGVRPDIPRNGVRIRAAGHA